jgi:hypothetical protein
MWPVFADYDEHGTGARRRLRFYWPDPRPELLPLQGEDVPPKEDEMVEEWVVYRPTIQRSRGDAPEGNAVCARAEWDEMERARPAHHRLVQAGIASEPEAERLARSAPGGTAPGAR